MTYHLLRSSSTAPCCPAVKVLIDKEAMTNAGPKGALSLPGSLLAKLDEASCAGGRALAEQGQLPCCSGRPPRQLGPVAAVYETPAMGRNLRAQYRLMPKSIHAQLLAS